MHLGSGEIQGLALPACFLICDSPSSLRPSSCRFRGLIGLFFLVPTAVSGALSQVPQYCLALISSLSSLIANFCFHQVFLLAKFLHCPLPWRLHSSYTLYCRRQRTPGCLRKCWLLCVCITSLLCCFHLLCPGHWVRSLWDWLSPQHKGLKMLLAPRCLTFLLVSGHPSFILAFHITASFHMFTCTTVLLCNTLPVL